MLQEHLTSAGEVLELGSGTGQHASWLTPRLCDIVWRPTDVAEALPGIQARLHELNPERVHPPLTLDVRENWPTQRFDYIFTANTFHIMDSPTVAHCIQEAGAHLKAGGLFLVYGPFRYKGECSDSNARFDAMLRTRDPDSGLRDYEWIREQMAKAGLVSLRDHAMPANNRLLVFRHESGADSQLSSAV